MSPSPRDRSWIAAVYRTKTSHEPLGAAVVIDKNRVLTCAHVIRADGAGRESLWVGFPLAGDQPRRQVATWTVAYNPPVRDVAVLGLDGPVPAGVRRARLRWPRPEDLAWRAWWAFGFPGGDPKGNSAGGIVGEPLGHGWVRLDASSRYKVGQGFSGGPVWCPDYQAVVGIIGQANADGDAQAITVHGARPAACRARAWQNWRAGRRMRPGRWRWGSGAGTWRPTRRVSGTGVPALAG